MLWSWSCVQVDPGVCYLQVLGSADIQAGDVLDPLIDLIHNSMLKRCQPGADGQDRVNLQLKKCFYIWVRRMMVGSGYLLDTL